MGPCLVPGTLRPSRPPPISVSFAKRPQGPIGVGQTARNGQAAPIDPEYAPLPKGEHSIWWRLGVAAMGELGLDPSRGGQRCGAVTP